jgi:hypothetical protein
MACSLPYMRGRVGVRVAGYCYCCRRLLRDVAGARFEAGERVGAKSGADPVE